MNEATQPSAGAMRAARALDRHLHPDDPPTAELAEIIDRETGLPELLAVCDATASIQDIDDVNKAILHAQTVVAAIAAAEGKS